MGRSRSGSRWPGRAAALVALALAATVVGYSRPPAASAATSPFTDIAGTTFEADIDWLYAEGITVGCLPTLYCPTHPVARGQMASFLVRMFELTEGAQVDAFRDDDGTTHEADINRLAYAGIAKGCTPTQFCPYSEMRRDDMASFLARAIPLTAGAGNNYFRDDDGMTHEANIDRVAAAGIVAGCGPWRYCPTEVVTRGQLAAYLRRIGRPLPPPPYPAPPNPQTLHVSKTGSDAGNACLDSAAPCASPYRAIAMAVDGDTIEIGPGTFGVERIFISKDLTIRGATADTTTIAAIATDTYGHYQMFRIESGATVEMRSMTVTDAPNVAVVVRGSLVVADMTFTGNDVGAAIVADSGSLTVVDSRIIDNATGIANMGADATITGSVVADNARGGVWLQGPGSLSIDHTVITRNTALYGAGVQIYQESGAGTVSITDSTISDNRGGGIFVLGASLRLRGSTVSGNDATGPGGGLYIRHASSIANSTIVGNSADQGGGIALQDDGGTTISNTTITGNAAATGAGIALLGDDPVELPYPTVTLKNAIVAGNSGSDISGQIAQKIANIIGLGSGGTMADILDPGGLADHGGPTETIALTDVADNPAIDHGDAATCTGPAVNSHDQRGLPRTTPCDVGAYELQP